MQIGRTDKTLFTQAKGHVVSGAPNKHAWFLLVEAGAWFYFKVWNYSGSGSDVRLKPATALYTDFWDA